MSSQAVTQPTAEPYTPVLDKKQLKRLNFLGYRQEDIDRLGYADALQAIATRTARPGSKAAINQNLKSLAGIPAPAGIDRFSDEAIEQRNAALPESSGVQVTRSEFTNQCFKAAMEPLEQEYSGRVTSGADPLNAVLMEMEARYAEKKEVWENGRLVIKSFPTRRFRWMHDKEPPTSGPAWDVVRKADGSIWTNGELTLCWMPQNVYEQGILKPQVELGKKYTAQLEQNKTDVLTRTDDNPNETEGILQTGKSEANYA
jgi:hypothetical protein